MYRKLKHARNISSNTNASTNASTNAKTKTKTKTQTTKKRFRFFRNIYVCNKYATLDHC